MKNTGKTKGENEKTMKKYEKIMKNNENNNEQTMKK
jgi:hypothetical protein